MQDVTSFDYYRSRERQERSLAERAPDRAIAAIHRDLAERYLQLTLRLNGGEPRPG